MTAGVAAQEPLWGVQHAHVTAETTSTTGIVHRVSNLYVARSVVCPACYRANRRNCVVVVSADGGRTWQPAGETP